MKNLYTVWIKIDETLPWVELKGTYPTRSEAQQAAKKFLKKIRVKIIEISEIKREIKALTAIK